MSDPASTTGWRLQRPDPGRAAIVSLAILCAVAVFPTLRGPAASARGRLTYSATADDTRPSWQRRPGRADDAETRAQSHDRLRELRIASRALSIIRRRYVEPSRLAPAVMLSEALHAIAHAVPEMLVSPRDDGGVDVHMGEATHTARLPRDADVFRLNWALLEAVRFVAARVTPDVVLDNLEYIAVNGMLSTLDPYSYMLDPERYRDMRTSTGGRFGGLGIRIMTVRGVLTVVGVIEGSPAEDAGLHENDQIIAIDGVDTLNTPIDDAVSRLRGEVGSTVTLSVRREGWKAPRAITLARAVIKLRSVESRVLDNGVGYARIKHFQRDTAEELRRTVRELEGAGGTRGLVLDLRDNPGGLLDEAVKVADLFIDAGPLLITVAGAGRRRDVRRASSRKTWDRLPLVVLVNGRSASASEIVAGALKHTNRALVMGERTYGKATVQVPYEIGAGALKLTIAKYLVPGDVNVQDVGIVPDIAVDFLEPEGRTVQLGRRERRAHRHPHARGRPRPAPEPTARPAHRLRILLPDRKRADSVDASLSEGAEGARDRAPIRRAARLLAQAGSPQAATMLTAARALLAQMQRDDEAALTRWLSRRDINWQMGPTAGAAGLRVQARLIDADGPLRAGDTAKIAVSVRNTSKVPVYRVHMQTHSDAATFDGLEALFGRLGPGAVRHREIRATISKRHRDATVPVEVALAVDGKPIDSRATIEVPIEALLRPSLELRYHLDDADPDTGERGDGVLQPGERGTLRVQVRSGGGAPTTKLIGTLRSIDGDVLHLEQARVRAKGAAIGAAVELAFPVRAAKGKQPPEGVAWRDDVALLEAELAVWDNRFGEQRALRVTLPWRAEPLPSALTATTDGADGPQPAAESGEPTALESLRARARFAAEHWSRPPQLLLGDDASVRDTPRQGAGRLPVLRRRCATVLQGSARFDETVSHARPFVTVSVNGTKQRYMAADGRTRLDFVAAVTLDRGRNAITIEAQDGPDRIARRTIQAHCLPEAAAPRP